MLLPGRRLGPSNRLLLHRVRPPRRSREASILLPVGLGSWSASVSTRPTQGTSEVSTSYFDATACFVSTAS